jgi:hypothetical protein
VLVSASLPKSFLGCGLVLHQSIAFGKDAERCLLEAGAPISAALW